MAGEPQFPQLGERCYLDHAAAALPSSNQLERHLTLLQSTLLLNPHSVSSSGDGGDLSGQYVEEARKRILEFFGAGADEYTVVFTSGATEAIRKVGECFDYGHRGTLCYLDDNHTSVLGVREYALARGAHVCCVTEEQLGELALQEDAVQKTDKVFSRGLFVYPAQSNFSGRKYNLDWVRHIKEHTLAVSGMCSRWYVMVDAASFVSTSPLSLNGSLIDFVPISFYKIFGYPTGCGALLVRKAALPVLKKRYFGGGTVEGAGVHKFFHHPHSEKNLWFEDGTLPFQQIAALQFGFDEIAARGGMQVISSQTYELAKLSHDTLQSMTHYNGAKVVQLYCDTEYRDCRLQGPILCFNLRRSNGDYIGCNEVQRLGELYKIVFRTGCFCNIGACQSFLGISTQQLQENHRRGHKCGNVLDLIDGCPTGAVRVSFGSASAVSDVQRLVDFIREAFCEKPPATPVDAGDNRLAVTPVSKDIKLSGINLYPIKSCAAFKVREWPLSETGLLYDRTWSILNADGVCLTLKRHTDLRKVKPQVDLKGQVLVLTSPGFEDLSLPLHVDPEERSIDFKLCSVKICGKLMEMVDCGEAAAAWVSDVLAMSGCRLVRQKVQPSRSKDIIPTKEVELVSHSLSNDSQYLLISADSVTSLCHYIRDEMNCDVEDADILDRFRANLVVSGAGADEEVGWSRVQIGGDSVFECVGECERCSMISVDPESGAKRKEPLRSLTRRKGSRPSFGIHLRNAQFKPGSVRVGDTVEISH